MDFAHAGIYFDDCGGIAQSASVFLETKWKGKIYPCKVSFMVEADSVSRLRHRNLTYNY